jgi:NAD kinase
MNYFDIIHAYLGFLVSFYDESADQNEKNIVGSEYRNNPRYFLSVSYFSSKPWRQKTYAPILELYYALV